MSRSRRHGSQTSPRAGAHPDIAGTLRGWLLPLTAAAVIVVAGLWAAGLFRPGGGGQASAPAPAASSGQPASSAQLPRFITAAPARVREAYQFAATHQGELAYIPCYCGCGGHSGHRDVRDCFIKQVSASGITYEQHGSTCDVCVGIVLDAKEMLAQGQSLASVRKAIDATYSKIGPGTDTPLPPGMEE